MRALAWVLLAAFLAGCTKDVVRGPMEPRHYAVDMAQLDARRIVSGGLEIESLVLTPAQWPLEASFKKLFQGDFIGIIDNFDLSFRSSRLRDDTLERLFDAGYLPVFLRVRNQEQEELRFAPEALVVTADSSVTFYPVSPAELPARFREIDWAQTGLSVVLVALMVVLIVASAKEGRSGGSGILRLPNRGIAVTSGRGRRRGQYRPAARASDEGLLRAGSLKPGESMEGFLFFQMDQTVADWTTARIEVLP
jgi:hypothetical protein